jgi:Flp pilus assembly protein TadG
MNTRSRFLKGQMLALFTIVLPVLLGVMALGADFAIIYLNWSMVQKAADAAALAGASQLTAAPGSAAGLTPAVDNYVNGYACLNGIKNGTSTLCSHGTSQSGYADNIVFTNVTDTQVSVGLKRSVPYYFGKMIGLQEASVAATATAAVEATGAVPNGMFPVGLQCTPNASGVCDLASLFSGQKVVTFGSKFVLNNLNQNVPGSGGAPGNWDWVNAGQGSNPGASTLGTLLQVGASTSFTVGQTISATPGVGKFNSQPAQNGLSARLSACASVNSNPKNGTVTDPCANGGDTSALNCTDPCLITVPAVNFTGCTGSCPLPIEGFALMYLEQNSTTSAINACYISKNTCTTNGSASAPNLGSLAPPVLIN